MRGQSGFSLAETTVILAAITLLAATAAPSIIDYVAQARAIKARGDVHVLASALSALVFDVSELKRGARGERPELLVGPGDLGTAEPGVPTSAEWTAPEDGGRVQRLVDHLVSNAVVYAPKSDQPFARGWGGPYLEDVPVDPWGHRYVSNVGMLRSGTPVVVLSAGPNGRFETPFLASSSQTAAPQAGEPGSRDAGDDVLARLGTVR